MSFPPPDRLDTYTDSDGQRAEAIMSGEPWNERGPVAESAAPMPEVTDRATWQAQLDELLVREKAHTREGDAIAVARRRLPIVEVDPSIPVTGEHGQVPLVEVFEGRRQLIVYFHMWHAGKPAAAARDSAMNRRRNDGSAVSAGVRIFSATDRPSRWSRA